MAKNTPKVKVNNSTQISKNSIKKNNSIEVSGNSEKVEITTTKKTGASPAQKKTVSVSSVKSTEKQKQPEVLQTSPKVIAEKKRQPNNGEFSGIGENLQKESNNKAKLKNSSQVYYDSGIQGKKAKVLKKDNTGKLLVSLSAISLVLIMVVMGQFFILESTDPSNTLFNGTIINGVNVGGMDIFEAEQLIYDVFKEKSNNFKLELTYKDKSWVFDKDDFKVNSSIHTIIEEAQKRDEINSSFQNQSEALEKMKKEGVSINVAFNYIFVGLDDKINNIIKEIEIEPVNSQISFNGNGSNPFNITEHKNGLRVNREQLYFEINEQFNKSNTICVAIPTVIEEPEITKEYNESVTKKISSFTTYVSDSTGARKSNVKLALEKFNGFVIEPGEEVSFNKVTGPHSLENGYKVATVIYNGQFVDGVGGGICQASTTLYNALINAGVEIVEVHKHTLPVKYVPLATDAMVSEYVADLKFKNNSTYPVFIVTESNAESVNVKIYSHPLEYEIKTRAEVVNTIPHGGDEVKCDQNKEYSDKVLFKGEQFRLTYPRDGYEAVAYLEYYKNGEKVKEQQIRHEIYAAQKGIIIEGCEEVPAGMCIIDGKVEKIEPSEQASSMNNNNPTNLIPTNVCP